MTDNPDLLRDDPGYRTRLKGLGSPELVRALEDGDWDIVAGGAVDDVWKRERPCHGALQDSGKLAGRQIL